MVSSKTQQTHYLPLTALDLSNIIFLKIFKIKSLTFCDWFIFLFILVFFQSLFVALKKPVTQSPAIKALEVLAPF